MAENTTQNEIASSRQFVENIHRVKLSVRILHMDNRPITPKERIEARRIERETRREFLRHYSNNPWKFWVMVTEYLTWVKSLSVAEYRKNLNRLLKALRPSPKFCNGLTGNSRTDSLIAPAIN
jgi:myosin-crossreactive antigen